jgi:hypothetical protein
MKEKTCVLTFVGFTAMEVHVLVFWVLTPFSLVDRREPIGLRDGVALKVWDWPGC